MVSAGRTSSKTARVLYVDPAESDRRRAQRDLEEGEGRLEVEGVGTVADLRDSLADDSHTYTSVVTEYTLDETDAFSLYATLQADGLATAPFVLYTDDGDETLASDAITTGFAGYVPKERDDSIDRLRDQLRTVAGLESTGTAETGDRNLEQYRTLVETVGDSMYVLDAAGTIEMANEAMAESLEESRKALVGRQITEFVDSDDVDPVRSTLEEIRATDGRSWGTVEVTVELTDDTRCAAEVNVAPLVDEDGALTGSVGVVRDISARKEREHRIRALHDGTRRLMAATDPDEIATTVIEIACDALDLRLTSVHRYQPEITTRSVTASSDGTTDGIADSQQTDGTADSQQTDGTTDPDETDEQDEERGGLVPAAMSDPVLELFDGVAPYIEPGGGIAWDAYEAGEAIVHGDVRRAPNVRNPETPIRSEAHIPLGDHGIIIISSLETNDFDPDALTLARILAANAEAALDRAERECELADRSRELERQNDRLEAFASTVSHDLRNPLSLAMGHCDLLADVIEEEEVEEAADNLEEIEWALDRMDDLIEHVLTLARSGQQLTEAEPVDLTAVAERAHRTVDPGLDVTVAESVPTVDADRERLRVLFENTFRNAREHGGNGVTVTVSPTSAGFAIADDGPGVAPDERESILEWGYSTAAEGTGFGLAIVAEIVEAHGWSISIEESDAGGLRLAVAVDP